MSVATLLVVVNLPLQGHPEAPPITVLADTIVSERSTSVELISVMFIAALKSSPNLVAVSATTYATTLEQGPL